MTVNFTGTSTGSPISWAWDFGDGQLASTPNAASHTYVYTKGNGKQSWTATLTVTVAGTGSHCQASDSASVDMNP